MDADHGRGVWVTHNPSGLWSVGGPIIRRERIELDPNPDWDATGTMWAANVHWGGETALVAAMRCYVASKFGEYIDMM